MKQVTIGGATLIMGDALDTIAALEPGSVDSVVMDPPYCSGSVSEASRSAAKRQGVRPEMTRFGSWFVGDNMGTAGLVFLLRSIAFESLRAMSAEGSMLTFCDWRMVPNIAPAIESAGFRFQNLIVWDKDVLGLGAGFRAQHELVLQHTAGSPKYHHLGTGNVLRHRRVGRDDREHQTMKPVALMEDLLRVVSDPGHVILDPFMGSGTTGVAALKMGRRFIGIERDPEHFATACRRLEDVQVDLPVREHRLQDLFGAATA